MSSLVKKRLGKSAEETPVMQTQEKPILQKPFSKTYTLYGTHNRRDAIIALIQQQHRGEPFVVPFVPYVTAV